MMTYYVKIKRRKGLVRGYPKTELILYEGKSGVKSEWTDQMMRKVIAEFMLDVDLYFCTPERTGWISFAKGGRVGEW